jgi:hypothetical protein
MTTTRHTHTDQLDAARLKAALPESPTHDDIARRLQGHTGGRWSIWYGHSTRRYWAIRKPPGTHRLVEGATPDELITAMNEVDTFYASQTTPPGGDSATVPGAFGADRRSHPRGPHSRR